MTSEEVDAGGYEPRHDGNLDHIDSRMIPPDGEGLQSPFDRRLLRTAECIQKLRCTAFYLSENTFGAAPISVVTHSKSAPDPRRRRPEVVSVVGQNRRVGTRHNPSKFIKNHTYAAFLLVSESRTRGNSFVPGLIAMYS